MYTYYTIVYYFCMYSANNYKMKIFGLCCSKYERDELQFNLQHLKFDKNRYKLRIYIYVTRNLIKQKKLFLE